MDIELFGEAIFSCHRSNLKRNNVACGCAKNFKYSEEQVRIIAQREAEKRGYKFKDFAEPFDKRRVAHIKCIFVCQKHGEWSTTTFSSFTKGTGCTVIAFAVALNTTYGKAHKHMQSVYGRQERKGVYIRQHPNIGLTKTKHKIGPYTEVNRISVPNFVKTHPKGRYYCLSRGHAFAIIDGVVWDHTYRPRAQIVHAVRIYLED